jgi:hypothetical protein
MNKRFLLLLASMLSVAPLVLATCVGSSVYEAQQGRQYNHAAIPSSRSNPANAIDDLPDNQFYSLGFYPQGHLTLELDQALQSGTITIWETTWRNGSYCLETASVEVAGANLDSWVQVGIADNDRGAGADFHVNDLTFDSQLLGFCVKYVRITETSNLADIARYCNTGDGFDIDAVCVSGATCQLPEVVGAQEMPTSVTLKGNWPNPFNPVTSVHFSLPETGMAKLEVFNLAGNRVATLVNGMLEAGEHQVSFDASKLPSGVYLARLEAANRVESRKMTLLK